MLFFTGQIVSRHINLTESEFDNTVAEWLRFAKQRKQREDKNKKQEDIYYFSLLVIEDYILFDRNYDKMHYNMTLFINLPSVNL